MIDPGDRDDDSNAAPSWQPPRALGIALAIAASSCLVTACFSHRWLANPHLGDIGYSPLSYRQCDAACVTTSNFQVFENANDLPFEEDRSRADFPIAGLVTFVVPPGASARPGSSPRAGIAAAGGHPDLPVSPTTFALLGLMVGLVTGCVFVATKPGAVGAVGVSWSFWTFGAGAVAGIAATHLLARRRFARWIRICCTMQ